MKRERIIGKKAPTFKPLSRGRYRVRGVKGPKGIVKVGHTQTLRRITVNRFSPEKPRGEESHLPRDWRGRIIRNREN